MSKAKPAGRHRTLIDQELGKRLREWRVARGLSQQKLGAAIGVTFQQIQKYERGFNRISAGRLFELSRVLDVPVGSFFEGLDDGQPGVPAKPPGGGSLKSSRESLALMQAYGAIESDSARRALRELAGAFAEGGACPAGFAAGEGLRGREPSS